MSGASFVPSCPGFFASWTVGLGLEGKPGIEGIQFKMPAFRVVGLQTSLCPGPTGPRWESVRWGWEWTVSMASASGNSITLQMSSKSFSSFSTVLLLFPMSVNSSGNLGDLDYLPESWKIHVG